MRLALDRHLIDRWLAGAMKATRDAAWRRSPPWRRAAPGEAPDDPRSLAGIGSILTQGPFVGGGDAVKPPPRVARSPFTPTRPVQTAEALVGREAQLDRALAALEVEGAHLAIYGERGHGKTSLANVVAAMVETRGFGVVRHSCSAESSFSDVMSAVLDKVPARFLRRAPLHPDETTAATAGPQPEWTVGDVTAVFERIRAGHLVVFVDEYDRLRNERARSSLTELLKNISDLGLRISFVLIGVAETLGELLALHQSVQRCLVAIPLPLLTDDALGTLIERGCKRLGMRLDPDASALLLRLSHRSPYFAQLLCLHATQMVPEGGVTVTVGMVAAAGRRVLDETYHVFEPVLQHVSAGRVTAAGIDLFDLLFVAATGPCDPFGWFKAANLAVHGLATPVTELDDALATLTRSESGPVLRQRLFAGVREFAFARANLRNHVLLRGAHHRGLI